MGTYIVLTNFTDQRYSRCQRQHQAGRCRKGNGEKIQGYSRRIFSGRWESYDVVAIFEAPDDASMTAFGLAIGSGGNVRTQTLRAFSREAMNGILARLA